MLSLINVIDVGEHEEGKFAQTVLFLLPLACVSLNW